MSAQGGWGGGGGAHLLMVFVVVRAHDVNSDRADEWHECVRDLLPLARLGCAENKHQ